MSIKLTLSDYEPVVRSRSAPGIERDGGDGVADGPSPASDWPSDASDKFDAQRVEPLAAPPEPPQPPATAAAAPAGQPRALSQLVLKRAHAVSFLGLFLFTSVVYFRPYELFLTLAPLKGILAYWLAILTALAYIPSQMAVEGRLTARPREVNLVLLLTLAAMLSIPLAIEPSTAWAKFVDFSKVVFMFIVMVNVVRTERRLKYLILLALAVSLMLSIGAINDYRIGHFALRGERIQGKIGNLFDNPNDLALHLVTIIPIALGLLFMARGFTRKIFYGVSILLMTLATVFTFSRGGFLALMVATFVMAWKLARRNRHAVVVIILLLTVMFFALAPKSYAGRIASIFDNDLDTAGSAASRQQLLIRSLQVTARHPLLGVGMYNFQLVSYHDQVSHNAYTQVSADLGVPAMVIYVLFILTAIKGMRKVENETFAARRQYRAYYLAVGMQASLIGYMVSSFFASVAYQWNIYYLVGYALCLYRLHEAGDLAPAGAANRVAEPAEAAPVDGHAAAFSRPLAIED